jgi:CheY-like chemotaxis protein
MRMLVAEDERLMADAIAVGLRRRAMAVDVCHDGDAALERVRRWPGPVHRPFDHRRARRHRPGAPRHGGGLTVEIDLPSAPSPVGH